MIYNLQILRAVAAYLVVFNHAQFLVIDIHPHLKPTNIGFIGVDIFFVISGFIMVFTAGGAARSTLSFWRDRLIRIVPLYWLATFCLVGLSVIGFAPSGLHGWDLKDLLASLLFIPDIRKDGVTEPILFVGWTLNYEMFFYFFFGLALLLRNQLRSVLMLTGFFVGLWAAGRLFAPLPFIATFYTQPIILEFAAGCILGLIYLRSQIFTVRRPYAVALPLLALAAAGTVLGDIFYRELVFQVAEARLLMFGLPAIAIVIGALVLEQSGKRFTGEFFLLQGAASYSVYLFHTLVLQTVFKTASKLVPLDAPLFTTLISVVGLLGVCIAGTMIHLWFEKPVTRYLRGARKPLGALEGLSLRGERTPA